MPEQDNVPGGRTITDEDETTKLPDTDAPEMEQTADAQAPRRKLPLGSFTPGLRAPVSRQSGRASWASAVRKLTPIGERIRTEATRLWERAPKSREELRAVGPQVRDEVRGRAPLAKEWAQQHRAFLAGLLAVLIFVGADSTLARIPTDAPVEPGLAQRVPVAYPLQVQAPAATAKRYLDAINSGEQLRESAVVAAAARSTLERAKAEAAAAVAGENSPWLNSGADSGGALPPGFVPPGAGGYVLPAIGAFTSGFGQRWGTFHAGIDIAGPLGTPIYAVAAGTVIDAGPAQGFGLWVRIRHDDGTISVYGHMYDFFVSVGERVPAGMQIARIGNRGDSTGPHLHFEIIVEGQHVDPQRWLALHGLSLG